jgi:hypothetical protein
LVARAVEVCQKPEEGSMRRVVLLLAVLCAFVLESPDGTAAAPDIVLYASDVSTIQGNWTRTTSSTAAGGQQISSVDNGAPTASAVAAPRDFFEATFTAPANTPYHVWLRLRANADSKVNDSVWVQFGDAIDAKGSALYPVGSTSGLLINLENCSGCGVAGWGWQDGAYWFTQSSIVAFRSPGAHTIRIQTREDGVRVDQIVLSPSNYLSSAPGQVTNDATIISKPPVTAKPTPFHGTPAAIPGTIQNEDFDNGGGGVAYGDTTPGNAGGQYRATDVDIESTADGLGYALGWVVAGEWLTYTVNVATTGPYTLGFRVASKGAGGTFHLEMNGTNVTGPMRVPDTGSWQNWTTISATATLTAGAQVARLVMDTMSGKAIGNFDRMEFAKVSSGSAPGAPATPTPSTGAIGVPITPALTWSASGATSYDVRFGNTNPPATIVASNVTAAAYAPAALAGATVYYWQVVARNSAGSTTGPVWSFTTVAATTAAPRLIVFQKSADDATSVTSYLLEVFASGANPATTPPLASSDLGKPAAAVNGDITVDRSSFFSALAPGSYLATVSAIGPAGRNRSAALVFTR